jgi:FAD binding domain of DNA photolyase
VPELAAVPAKYIHTPWAAPSAVQQKARVQLGETYPERLTPADFAAMRQRNVDAIRAARARHSDAQDSNGYDVIDVPQGAATGVRGGRVRVFTVPGIRGASGNANGHAVKRQPGLVQLKGKQAGAGREPARTQRLVAAVTAKRRRSSS